MKKYESTLNEITKPLEYKKPLGNNQKKYKSTLAEITKPSEYKEPFFRTQKQKDAINSITKTNNCCSFIR